MHFNCEWEAPGQMCFFSGRAPHPKTYTHHFRKQQCDDLFVGVWQYIKTRYYGLNDVNFIKLNRSLLRQLVSVRIQAYQMNGGNVLEIFFISEYNMFCYLPKGPQSLYQPLRICRILLYIELDNNKHLIPHVFGNHFNKLWTAITNNN